MSFSNKIKGCLMGYAIGDALGRGTDFMSRPEVALRYPEGLTQYDQILRSRRRGHEPGMHTVNTGAALQLAESIIECNDVDYHDFARRYKKWFDERELDDHGSHIRHVLQQPDFVKNPHAACHRVYHQQGLYEAPNEALGRALVLGLWPRDIERNITDNCHITHWDSRCVTSCIIAATMANELLWHRREATYDQLAGIAVRLDKTVLPYVEAAHDGTLDDFNIDDEETYWYVRKTLGTALWALWHHTDPSEALIDVISYGGDGACNGALTMGLLGLKYGYKNLPTDMIEKLVAHERINDVAERLITTLRMADGGGDTDD